MLTILLILAIMMAVAIPLLLGATHQGNAQMAEASLTSSITAANESYIGVNGYTRLFSSGCSSAVSAYLSSQNDNIQYTNTSTDTPGQVAVACTPTGHNQTIIMLATFAGGGSSGADCLAVAEARVSPPNLTLWPKGSTAGTGLTAGGPYYAIQTPSISTCAASSFKTATGWQSSWRRITIP